MPYCRKNPLLPVSITYSSNNIMQVFLKNLKYLIAGIIFGFILMKAEVISWYRIQEMFRLQSFHMFGVIGSAIVTGIISIKVLKLLKVKALNGQKISIVPEEWRKGHIYGGFIFGIGWALTGACPGPLFAQVGSGHLLVVVTIVFAIVGTWTYGRFANRLPRFFKGVKSRNKKRVVATHTHA